MLTLSFPYKSIRLRFAAFLFLYLNSTLAFALGLGDIELKSHLNEALNARIALSDADTALESGCFTATDASEVGAFKKAYVTYKKTNGVSQLNIISYDIITEPIVNLLVAFHCEPTISREYVLLMDPAPTVSPEVIAAEKSALTESPVSNAPKGKKRTPKVEQASINAVATTNDALQAAEKSKKKRKSAKAKTIDDKLAEAYTGKAVDRTDDEAKVSNATKASPMAQVKPSQIKPNQTRPSTDKPFLIISGGSAENNANGRPNLSLRLETKIDFERTEAAPVITNSVEEADEVTVMANRLAHLEKQIVSLQTKNTQLQAENEKVKNESFKISPAVYEWLQRILIGLGIIIVIAVAELLRRKIMLNRLQQDQAVWFDAEAADKDIENLPDSKNISASIFNEPTFGNSFPPQPNEFAGQATSIQAETDEVENVLDHADVFIEHGRPALAIQLLQNHLEDAPAESPAVWMKLLSLLAKEDTASDYETAVKECNQFFNIKMPSFAEAETQDNSTIEDHPHIVTRLEGVWGSQYAIGFLNDLIYNQQSQPREGFERNTFEELFFLKQIATILQSNNPASATAYKPEVVKPLLENAEINRTLFTGNAESSALENHIQYERINERTSETPAQTHVDENKHPGVIVSTDSDHAETDVIPEPDVAKDDFSRQAYEIDMILEAEEISAEPPASRALDFEALDFDVSTEDIQVEAITETPALPIDSNKGTTHETDFDIEESDADIINKYLSEVEEKAKQKPAPAKDSNVIEFEWDLPKIHKD